MRKAKDARGRIFNAELPLVQSKEIMDEKTHLQDQITQLEAQAQQKRVELERLILAKQGLLFEPGHIWRDSSKRIWRILELKVRPEVGTGYLCKLIHNTDQSFEIGGEYILSVSEVIETMEYDN